MLQVTKYFANNSHIYQLQHNNKIGTQSISIEFLLLIQFYFCAKSVISLCHYWIGSY